MRFETCFLNLLVGHMRIHRAKSCGPQSQHRREAPRCDRLFGAVHSYCLQAFQLHLQLCKTPGPQHNTIQTNHLHIDNHSKHRRVTTVPLSIAAEQHSPHPQNMNEQERVTTTETRAPLRFQQHRSMDGQSVGLCLKAKENIFIQVITMQG